MPVTLEIIGLQGLDSLFRSIPSQLSAGVKVTGAHAHFALVWEYGSVRITKPGPKTTWGINPNGERVILTITAPNGYIRINHQKYLEILQEEYRGINLSQLDIGQWDSAFRRMLSNAEERCAQVIRDTAPEDTGQLKDGIVPAGVDSDIAINGTANDFGSTEFDLGDAWA